MKKALIYVILALKASTAISDPTLPLTPLEGCKGALNACQGLVAADDQLVIQLKQANKELEVALEASNKPLTTSIWPYILVFIGGVVAGKVLIK